MDYEAVINDCMLSDDELLTLAGIADNSISDDDIENLKENEAEAFFIDVLKALLNS